MDADSNFRRQERRKSPRLRIWTKGGLIVAPKQLCLDSHRNLRLALPVVRFFLFAIIIELGMLSMGFQMLASRLLNPSFGSTIVVWVWLISTFLAAFSFGSIWGGWVSSQTDRRRLGWQIATATTGVVSLAVTTFFGGLLLEKIETAWIPVSAMDDATSAGMNTALFISCMSLFFVPVTALSSFGPQCVHFLASRGSTPGPASGLVYALSTLGNIAGVMLTVFILIPNIRVSRLMTGWLLAAVAGLAALIAILSSHPRPPAR